MQLRSKIILSVILVLVASMPLFFLIMGPGGEAVKRKIVFGKKDGLTAIIDSASLKILTANNGNSYYIYRSKPTGFEYDLARKFAEHLEVELEIITPGWNELIPSLKEGEGDIIAAGMTITEQREEEVAFSSPYMTVQQKLIHHKLVHGPKDIEDLSAKEIHVRRNTSYHQRLMELRENGVDITIVLHDDIPTEELIRLVHEREIPFTVADSNIALLNRRYFPDIRIGMALEEEQFLGWAVARENQELLARINTFLEEMEEHGGLGKIYEKYYGAVEVFDYFDLKKFHERIESRLPKYKATIKQESQKFGFDWRLIAAQVYQESHFNPKARSYTGVKGLMQVTLATAREMGIDNRLDPQQSLKAGIRYLNKLYERFDEIEDREQRLLFAMAGYNIGYGHIRDAQKLAVDEGLDPKRWSSMKKVLPYLMQRKYYKKTTYGYARGREALTYVERIRTYYDILKQKAK
ncbi:MAG: membrane-bound lytic murein transglycosylase MltF [Desulfocapsaceae bacterium]|nr:membrane-bound lytic murein transglycosylase MltF [Desulfocapsaceae bacterium]